jgi:hypothetical protein
MKHLYLIGIYGIIHFAFNQWTVHTVSGRWVKDYLRNWKTDDLLHLILCAGSVWLMSVCAILAVGLAFAP